ncbi:MAG: hypothetical protein WBC71_13470 [Salaquimonas sp.]
MTLLKKTCAIALTAAIALGTALTFTNSVQAQSLQPVVQKHQTYLVNGLASVMPFVGYGFNNLQSKLHNARHYDYATPVEGRIAIQPLVLSDIKRQYAKDPSVLINLVGISYGANIVTNLAAQLNRAGIPVNYLAVLDGPMLSRITPNVHRVDNFVCRQIGCIGQHARLSNGNKVTLHQEFKMPTTHIALGDNPEVHQRIIGQLTAYPMLVAGQPIDTMHTAAIQ